MKKITIMLCFAIIAFISFSTVVNAADANLYLCNEHGVQQTFMIAGYALYIAKVVIPILLTVFGSIDMVKAVISSDSDLVKKQTTVLMKRAIAAVVIFVLPTIINFAFEMLTDYTKVAKDFDTCRTCLFEPGSCPAK